MGKKRPDGVYIDNINPYTKIMPHIMPHRYDAMNWCKVEVSCDGIDRFIAEQHKLGKRYSYYNVVMAGAHVCDAPQPQQVCNEPQNLPAQ